MSIFCGMLISCARGGLEVPAGRTPELRQAVLEQQRRIKQQEKPSAKSSIRAMRRVCDWQLAHPYRHPWIKETDWIRGAFYAGVMATYRTTGEEKYLHAARSMGERNQWRRGPNRRHADDQAIAQTYLEIFEIDRDPRMIASIRHTYDAMMAKPIPGRQEWWWCDALFMAPPTLARLAAVTGDPKYLDYMDRMWWDTTEFLYDKGQRLYHRDRNFFDRREKNGRKVFWSRGNGWVAAGICRVLEYMPDDYPTRPEYVELLREMAEALAKAQGADGMWRASLLDPESYPLGETSGTGFHCYAIAWGINHGYLNRKAYTPVVQKAWRALMACADETGRLGYTQMVAGAPGFIKPSGNIDYGAGAFLLAGSEMVKLMSKTKRTGAKTASGPSILPSHAMDKKLGRDSHLLAHQINRFLSNQDDSEQFNPTSLTRRDYLAVIDGQVQAMRNYQNAEGRIIDPIRKKEHQYATPCYAHAVAAVAAGGFNNDLQLLESGMRAMDVATSDMAAGRAPDFHGDFFTYPAMMALHLYEGIAPAERVAVWHGRLAKVDPRKLYMAYGKPAGNWTVVNLSGEYLRAKAGMTSPDYLEETLAKQLGNFTPLGMYHEGGDPLPYDHFPRHFLGGILQMGYRGDSYARCSDLIWRGAWTSLFMQSPFGELPTGYRSSHHIWNEAESAVTYEIYAAQYARQGRMVEAGAFKRAARLSLRSIKNWIREDGSGFIVKNRYPIEAQHGYEGYSAHTQYNLLACSMLAQAWLFADDRIEEKPAPCDIGGYVVPVVERFHKIFAAAGGNYVEYDTSGDQIYNPTGLIRIHLRGGHPQLGPSDGCAERYSGKGNSIAVGLAWKDSAGEWHSLAELKPDSPKIEVLCEKEDKASFRVTYNLRPAESDASTVTMEETITVEPDGVTVEDEVTGDDVQAMRITYPMLVYDGQEYTKIKLTRNTLRMSLGRRGVEFQIREPNEISLHRSGRTIGHRNGQMEPIVAEFAGRKAVYRISAWEQK